VFPGWVTAKAELTLRRNQISDSLPGPKRSLNVGSKGRSHEAAPAPVASGNSKRVYVGNLTFDCTGEELELHMAHVGKVQSVEILTSASGRSRGAGLVEYESAEVAASAIASLNRSELHGRVLQVREDREAHVQPTHEGNRLFVGNLSWSLQSDVLKAQMETVGRVQSCEVMYQPTGRSRGYAIVVYENNEDAKSAISSLNGFNLDGREIQVRYDRH